MFYRLSALTTVLCCLAAAPAAYPQLPPRSPGTPAPQAPPPPKPIKDEDVAKKLIELEKIGKDLDESKWGHNSKIIRELRDIGTSGDKAFALWLDCKKEFDFDQKGISATKWADYKRVQTKDANHDRDAGLQLTVKWLSIVLMYCNARTDSARNDAVNEAVAYLESAVDRIRTVEKEKDKETNGRDGGRRNERGPASHDGEGEMDQDVLHSLFAKHYKLDASVTRKDGGAFVPGDVSGIYEKMLLPYYRSMKQATNLMNAWKHRIEQETAIADAKHGNGPKEKFANEKLPELKWGQAVDYYKIGQEESAYNQLYSILKGNMDHPKAAQWIIELTALLKKEDPDIAQEKTPVKSKPGAVFDPIPEPEPTPAPDPAQENPVPVPVPQPTPAPAPPASKPAPAPTPAPAPAPAAPKTPPLVDPTKPERLVDPTKEPR